MSDIEQHYDAIVIGSGITGGWAAKELCEKGLKTLMLDRGRMVRHRQDYPTESKATYNMPYRGQWPRTVDKASYQSHLVNAYNYHFFTNDLEQPYSHKTDRPFNWVRGDIVGGRSLLWARKCYRLSAQDFVANKQDGHGSDWPIRYEDLASWYSYVEDYIGVSGEKIGSPQLPDGEFQPPMEMNIAEKAFAKFLRNTYDDRVCTIARTSNLTENKLDQQRIKCQYRAQCNRGCSFGAYFSTQSSTLPAAQATGKLTIRPDSVVESLEYDATTQRVTGVNVIDANTQERITYRARLIFLCASAMASVQILLNSRSETMPNGLGNNHDVVGRYIMDHLFGPDVFGELSGQFEEFVEYGRRPLSCVIPRFVNLDKKKDANFLRGYNFHFICKRSGPQDTRGFGKQLKDNLRKPGAWTIRLSGWGEILPYHDNRVTLDKHKTDKYGIPQLRFDVSWRENEQRMAEHMLEEGSRMLQAFGIKDIEQNNKVNPPGAAIHEMGGARMGSDPTQSVVNKWNQVHDAPNVFVTDGAAMTSSGCVNPSLTYMAMTVRAADYAAKLFKQGRL